jgi:hypothetical protein
MVVGVIMKEKRESVPESVIREAILAGKPYSQIVLEYHCSASRIATIKRKLEAEVRE